MLNRCVIAGRLPSDPELKHTTNSTAVCSFTLAVDRDYKNQNGENTDWIDVVCWRSTAEYVSKYASKGRMLIVNGRLQTRNWTDKEGKRHKVTEIVADNIYFAEKRDKNINTEISDNDFTEIEDDSSLPF